MGKSVIKWGDYMFMGEYHHTIDEKGRLTIPSKLREQLNEQIIITRGIDKCLFIYKKNDWDIIINKYKELPNTKDARNFMRFFLSGANYVEFDKQGRINIQKPLIDYADLNKNCIIIGVNDRLEVWNEDKWNEFVQTNEDNISDIAEKLFEVNI